MIKSYVIVVKRPKMVGKVLNRVYVFPIKVLYMLKKELIILTDKGSSLWNSIILTVYCFTFSLQPRSTMHPRLQMYNLKENRAPRLTILSQNVSNYSISLK